MDPTRTCNVSKLQAAAVGRTASSPRHPSRTIRILCRLQVLEDGIDDALAGTYVRVSSELHILPERDHDGPYLWL